MSIKLPIVKIAKLIGTLIKSAKGGIDDAEAQENQHLFRNSRRRSW